MKRAALLFASVLAGCPDEPPAKTSHGEIYVTDAGPGKGPAPQERYAYLAVRSLSAVGLAEARGLPDPIAKAMVDRIADGLEACVVDLAKSGTPPEGAARLVAAVGKDGVVSGTRLVADPMTPPVVATAKLCLEARVKLMAFDPAAADTRGFAIEAMWGHLLGHSSGGDAGAAP